MTTTTVHGSRRTATVAALAAFSVAGCSRNELPPVEPIAIETRPIRCAAEVRLWLVWHGYRSDEVLANLCDRLDRLNEEELRTFDRQSPSHIGYRDVRADLRTIIATHGVQVTVRDLAAVREECIGRWQPTDPPPVIP